MPNSEFARPLGSLLGGGPVPERTALVKALPVPDVLPPTLVLPSKATFASAELLLRGHAMRDSMGLIFVAIVRPCDVAEVVDANVSRRLSVGGEVDFRDSTTLEVVSPPSSSLDVHICYKGNYEGGRFEKMTPADVEDTFHSYLEADVIQVASSAVLDARAWRGLAKALPKYVNMRYLKLCFKSIDPAVVLEVLEAAERCITVEHIYLTL